MVCFESGILKISPVGSKRECGERNPALSNFTVFTQRFTTRLPHKLSLMEPRATGGHTETGERTVRITFKIERTTHVIAVKHNYYSTYTIAFRVFVCRNKNWEVEIELCRYIGKQSFN